MVIFANSRDCMKSQAAWQITYVFCELIGIVNSVRLQVVL